jgi:hypothetical protein
MAVQAFGIELDGLGVGYLGVPAVCPDFPGADEVLVQLLPLAQPREHDLDVVPAAHLDEMPGDVVDAHGLTHVQNQDLARSPDGAGLNHQLAGLGDGHEVSGRVLVRDGDRAATAYLLGEQGQHRPSGPEDIAEAHRGVPAVGVIAHPSGHLFGHAFGMAQDRGGVGGLVGGDVDEDLDVDRGRRLEHVAGTLDIGLPGLVRVLLQQGNVFQGRGVEDHLRPPVSEDPGEGLLVPDIGQHRVLTVQKPSTGHGNLRGLERRLGRGPA